MLTIQGPLPSVWISGLFYFVILRRMSLEFHWICRSLSVTQPFSQYHFFQPLSIWDFFFPSCNINSFFSGFTFSLWSSLVSLVRFFFPMFLFCFVVLGWFQDIVNRMFCGSYFWFFSLILCVVLVYRKLLIFMCWFCLLPLWWKSIKTVSLWWLFSCFQCKNVSPRSRINVFSKNINNLE